MDNKVIESEDIVLVDEASNEEITKDDKVVNEVAEIKIDKSVTKLSNVNEDTTFTKAIDDAKVNVVKSASANDKKFIGEFQDKLKDATLKLAEVEEAKAKLEEQNIDYHAELLKTQQELNEHVQKENKWSNREKRRLYHYNGVKPIMMFVGIHEPMNLFILYFLTIFIMPFFLLHKFMKGTIGALIHGAEDENRPKQVRGFLWTMLATIFVLLISLAVFLVLQWLGIVTI